MISRRASQFELQIIRDHQEARRGTCGVRCGTYWERASKRTITRDICCDNKKQLAAVKRGYSTRTHMVLPVAFYSPHVVCCLPSAIFAKKQKKCSLKNCLCGRKCIRMGWYLNCYYYKSPYVSASMDTRIQSGSTAETCGMVGWQTMTGSDTGNSPQHSEDTPSAHKWCYLPLLLCSRVVALCSPHVVCCLSSAILHK